MRNKLLPYPILLLLLVILYNALVGDDSGIGSHLFIAVVFLGAWQFVGPKREPPTLDDLRKLRSNLFLAQVADSRFYSMYYLWAFDHRIRKDKSYRRKIIAGVLAVLLIGTGMFAWLDESVIPWRAFVVMGLCASGLLYIMIGQIIHKAHNRRAE